MIKTLKRKFLFAAMLSVTILIVLLVACIALIGYVQMEQSADAALSRALELERRPDGRVVIGANAVVSCRACRFVVPPAVRKVGAGEEMRGGFSLVPASAVPQAVCHLLTVKVYSGLRKEAAGYISGSR